MGIIKKKSTAQANDDSDVILSRASGDNGPLAKSGATSEPPKLARRSLNHRSTIQSGRTIGERRERLETASERTAAHKKIHQKKRLRLIVTVVASLAIIAVVIYAMSDITREREEEESYSPTIVNTYAPTIEVIDEDATNSSGITSRMKEYIGQAEVDFRELGYTPVKAVVPSGAIREVDFYLDGYTGFIKLIIDRGSGVSVEDADRMIRYLANQGINDFAYIDVRIEGKAYWK